MGSHILEISGVTKFWAKSYLDGSVDRPSPRLSANQG